MERHLNDNLAPVVLLGGTTQWSPPRKVFEEAGMRMKEDDEEEEDLEWREKIEENMKEIISEKDEVEGKRCRWRSLQGKKHRRND